MIKISDQIVKIRGHTDIHYMDSIEISLLSINLFLFSRSLIKKQYIQGVSSINSKTESETFIDLRL